MSIVIDVVMVLYNRGGKVMRNDIDDKLRIQANDRSNEDRNNPLGMFSTTQLKKELRRRKGIIEGK